jgi:molybdopterin/thiamine biosynthesis adenylyltransferase
MSQALTSRNDDLRRLRNEGYEIRIQDGLLLVAHVPYVNAQRSVKYGSLVVPLSVSGDITTQSRDHTARFVGEPPCDENGAPLHRVINSTISERLSDGTVMTVRFSQKPACGYYKDHYEQVTTYVALLASHAQALDPNATAQTFAVVETPEADSVFKYQDTATSRAGIMAANTKLERNAIAIIGLGGTGSYVFDLVSKTPVRQIHLFDDDYFLQHNAFRAPGAASIEDLRAKKTKVAYYSEMYSKMRNGIVPHPYRIDQNTIQELRTMDFVFIAIDDGPSRGLIAKTLTEWGISFIDVGMGIWESNGSLGGQLRISTSTPTHRSSDDQLPTGAPTPGNDYEHNIQVADLNALGAVLAVIKWKKLMGFYVDLDGEHYARYTVDGNHLINEDSDR